MTKMTVIVGAVSLCVGLVLGVKLTTVISVDRVNRERKDNTYDRGYDE